MKQRRHALQQVFSTGLLCAGALLLAVGLLPAVFGFVMSHVVVSRFQADHPETMSWAPGRAGAYRKALRVAVPAPQAVLHIASVGLNVPVMEGASDLVLNRGVGHIVGTPLPGATGNMVLAGHRDGWFRRLRGVSVGDRVDIAYAGGTDTYRVDAMRVAERGDTSMLRGTANSTLTLFTCYPFVFLGAAPQRYVVTASLVSHQPLQAKLQ